MTLWQRFITIVLMLGISWIAVICTQSNDWRDRLLGWIVLIVYISIGVYHATRIARRTKLR